MFRLYIDKVKEFHANEPAEFWHTLLFGSFWLSIALFPIGYGFREVMPPLCLIFLMLYYRYAWNKSVLKRFKPKWLFFCALIMILIGVIFSINPWKSLLHAGTGINKSFILPFIAMECVKSRKNLYQIIWAFTFACFWEGLDGVWQAITGRDFIFGYEPRGENRLTGSLGDYTVGNYLALALIPAFGTWFILRQKLGKIESIFIFFALLWPAVFTLQGAGARSGVLAIAGVLALWVLLTKGFLNWRIITYPALVFIIFSIMQPARSTLEKITSDNRWDLWNLGWNVFKEHPIFGAGAGQYNAAFRELGLVPAHEVITISHPHNLYLDLLYAHGIVGFTLGMVFLMGFIVWGYKRIIPHLHKEISTKSASCYWRVTAWVGLGYAGWLINGIFGHDFYRLWWLAMAMTSLGIMIGAVINGENG